MRADVAELRRALEAEATPERATAEKLYLKSDLEFLGAPMPVIRRVAAAFRRAHPTLSRRELLSLATACWTTRVHELRSFAMALLAARVDLLETADLAAIERLLREARTWAHVDDLAVNAVGPLVERDPAAVKVLRRWARDEDFWMRRSALLSLLRPLREGGGDFALFAQLAQPMLDEKEFFIRKAIGWVLREVSKKRPALTFAFLREHLDRVSGLTLREGAKYLSPKQRRTLGLR